VYLYKIFKIYVKIMFRLTCSIIAHAMDINERFDSFRTIQTPIDVDINSSTKSTPTQNQISGPIT
jgi:hypothetical protein